MGEQYIFIFGLLVVALFTIGVIITIKEFKDIDAQKQKRYVERTKNIEVDKE